MQFAKAAPGFLINVGTAVLKISRRFPDLKVLNGRTLLAGRWSEVGKVPFQPAQTNICHGLALAAPDIDPGRTLVVSGEDLFGKAVLPFALQGKRDCATGVELLAVCASLRRGADRSHLSRHTFIWFGAVPAGAAGARLGEECVAGAASRI